MLQRPDTRLAERDTALPGLEILLDPERFATELAAREPDADIGPAHLRYVRYKPSTSCLAAYVIEVDGKPMHAYARCHREDQRLKVVDALRRRQHAGALSQGIIVLPEAVVAIHAFPNDHEIRSLRIFTGGRRLKWRLRRMIPGRSDLWEGSLEVLRYKPERRAVASVLVDGRPAAAIRLYPSDDFEVARAKSWAFENSGPLVVPTIVGDSGRYCAIAQEWIDGTPLTTHIADDVPTADLARVAEALSFLHRQRPSLRSMYTAGDYCASLDASARAVAALDPGLGLHAAEIYQRLAENINERPWGSLAVHGDFSPDQVIVQPDRIAIVDHDRAGYGNALIDVGAFVAGLHMLALTGTITAEQNESAADAFASAYCTMTGADERDAALLTACSLLRLAPEPFRHRHENWPDKIAGILEHIDRIVLNEAHA